MQELCLPPIKLQRDPYLKLLEVWISTENVNRHVSFDGARCLELVPHALLLSSTCLFSENWKTSTDLLIKSQWGMNQNTALPASQVAVSSAAALCELAHARTLQNFSVVKLPELSRRQMRFFPFLSLLLAAQCVLQGLS